MEAREPKLESLTGTAAAPLMHWLALVSGLAVLTVQREGALGKVVPLWIGGVLGTALGQLLAAKRVRLWLAIVVLANATFFGALLSAPLWLTTGRSSTDGLELAVLSFGPATLCAYLALGERAALLGMWFPSVPWILAMLDRAQGTAPDAERWVLLAGPAIFVVGAFYTREARRIAHWRGHATVALAASRPAVVMHEPPARALARGAWSLTMGTLALAVTVHLAPHLWQHDTLEHRAPALAAATGPGGAATSCCPEAAPVHQVREYFSPLTAHVAPPPNPLTCVTCVDGVPPEPVKSPQAPGRADLGSGPAPGGSAAPAGSADPSVHDVVLDGERTAPSAAPVASAARVPTAPGAKPSAHGPATAPPALPRPRITTAALTVSGRPRAASMHVVDASSDDGALPWLLALVVGAIVGNVALRPLRRLMAVRHMRTPLWPETVDQRVSNLWQLALVGLRDAGLRGAPGEAPEALARRSGVPAMSTCATVLERARHGVRVDAGDLEAMRRAAASVYDGARQSTSTAARAASWLRWPLV